MNRSNNKKGYTLMELLTVLAIIAIITAIAVPIVSGVVASSRLKSDNSNAQSYQSAISLWMTQNPDSGIAYKHNLSTAIHVGIDNNELTYTEKFMGTRQLPGIEFSNADTIRSAVITAIKTTTKSTIEMYNAKSYLPNPASTGYGYKYYYLTGIVSVEKVNAGYNLYTGTGNDYYIWLDYQPAATENVSLTTIAKINRVHGITDINTSSDAFKFRFALAPGQSIEYCTFTIENDKNSYTLSGKNETSQVFFPDKYSIKFYYNGDLFSDTEVVVNDGHVHDNIAIISFDGSGESQFSSNPEEFECTRIVGTSTCCLVGYHGTDTTVIVPSRCRNGHIVVELGDGLFHNNSTVEKIIVPSSVNTIRNGAIWKCHNLKYISLPSPNLESSAISGCLSLTDVNFLVPRNTYQIRSIGVNAIINCGSIKRIELPYVYRAVDTNAFLELLYNNYAINIDFMAPEGEMNLYEPNDGHVNYFFTSLSQLAYTGSGVWLKPVLPSNPTSLRISSTTVSNGAFVRHTIIRTPTEEERNAFEPFNGYNGELYIDEGFVTISENAFSNFHFTSIDLPSTLQTIGNSAFSGNKCVAIEIPQNVTSVGEKAFVSENLQTITIRCDLAAFNNKSFAGCERVTTLIIYNFHGDTSTVTPEQFGLPSSVKIIFV